MLTPERFRTVANEYQATYVICGIGNLKYSPNIFKYLFTKFVTHLTRVYYCSAIT